MKIVVCLKQVPDTTDIKWSKDNNIIREGLLSVLNPLDDYVLECALNLKQIIDNVFVTAVSMGPMQAKSVLEYALARCADIAVLLNDKKFVGSDTLATSKVLSTVIKNKISDFDLIICSQSAADGETAQTPPSLAQLLEVEYVSNVGKIIQIFQGSKKILVEQKTDYGETIIEVTLPAVISVLENEEIKISHPKIADFISGAGKQIKIYDANEISIDKNDCGIVGSPTYVHKVYRPIINRKCIEIENVNFAEFIVSSVNDVLLNKVSD